MSVSGEPSNHMPRDSPKVKRFLCGVPRESARPIFLDWRNCEWRLISGHVGKLVVAPTEYTLWRLHSTTGWSPPPPPIFTQMYGCFSIVFFHSAGDTNLLSWPPRSPDLTPCDFFLCGFVKDSVYVPLLPTPIQEPRDRITHVLQAITAARLHRVWDEFDCRVDVCRVTPCAYSE
jgi:hypothetical protein